MKLPAVALVTGAARRVGAAIVMELHRSGYRLILHCHTSLPEAETLCQQLNSARLDSARVVQADLQATPAALRTLLQQVEACWGRLDVLVNNASRFYPTALERSTDEMWDDLMGANAMAPFFLSQAAAPLLAKHQGTIVNICDIHAERRLRGYGIYCISKATLLAETQVLARELAPDIRVNGVSPGMVILPEGVNALDARKVQKILQETPLPRPGHPEDVAKAVRFLVMNAPYVTGQVLVVDGGRSLSG